jgi:methylenetetrahydrofolate reductase (NADPH)
MSSIAAGIGRGRFLSFELWPPRTPAAVPALMEVAAALAPLDPAFVAITYGAGGSTQERTHELVTRIAQMGLTPLPHLTCAAHHRSQLSQLMDRYRELGIVNLLALHGDPPLAAAESLPEGDLRHALDLVRLAREHGFTSIGVAVHPEGHPAATSVAADLRHQAAKLREADFAITQFFHSAQDYFELVAALRSRGAAAPIIPGVMPITSIRQLERMAAMSGSSIPVRLAADLHAVAPDAEAVRALGVAYATQLCRQLLEGGAPGLHFFTMNKAQSTLEVCANLGFSAP